MATESWDAFVRSVVGSESGGFWGSETAIGGEAYFGHFGPIWYLGNVDRIAEIQFWKFNFFVTCCGESECILKPFEQCTAWRRSLGTHLFDRMWGPKVADFGGLRRPSSERRILVILVIFGISAMWTGLPRYSFGSLIFL